MNEIDRIMAEDPINLVPRDYDTLIAWYRDRRIDFESGKKAAKVEGPKISLESLGLKPKAPAMKRRI